jgi:hypothetical protein
MIPRTLLALFLLAGPALLLGKSRFQTSPLQTEARTHTARGTVVNSATGEPINAALVQLNGGRQRSILTGPDGKFQFEGLANGYFQLTAQKPGYFAPEQLLRSGVRPRSAVRPLIFSAEKEDTPVTIRLVPEGVIYGRINGDNGEPVENIPVLIVWERVENGNKMRDANRRVETDEQGEFRIPELQPGKYFVFAGPSYWPVSFPAKLSQSGARGYSGVFYPGVPDFPSATPIEITAGKRAEINLSLTSQPFYRVSGTLSGYSPGMGLQLQIVSASGQQLGAGLDIDEAKGTFRSSWFPAGVCTVTAQAQDPKTNQQYFASQSLNVISDLAGVHLALVPGAVIPVSARVESTRNDTPTDSRPQQMFFGSTGHRQGNQQYNPAGAVLRPQGHLFSQQQQYMQSATEEDPTPAIRNVPPGVYSVEIQPNGPYYVQSARSGFIDLFEQNLTVAPGASNQTIEIVLRDDFASLEGSVTFEAQGEVATILVIPANAPINAQQPKLDVSVMGGSRSFQIPQLAPGEYKLLAVYNPEELEYGNPEAMRKYLSKTRDVSLAPNQKAKVELEVVRIGEGSQ